VQGILDQAVEKYGFTIAVDGGWLAR